MNALKLAGILAICAVAGGTMLQCTRNALNRGGRPPAERGAGETEREPLILLPSENVGEVTYSPPAVMHCWEPRRDVEICRPVSADEVINPPPDPEGYYLLDGRDEWTMAPLDRATEYDQ